MSGQNYRFKCRNPRCKYECLKRYSKQEFDELQYGGDRPGVRCFQCSFPAMAVIKSNQQIKDGFVPGFQRSIRKYCNTYSEYKYHLKQMGLVEMGYEDIEEDKDGNIVKYWTDDMLKKVYDHGFKFSDREADALKKGYTMEDGLDPSKANE